MMEKQKLNLKGKTKLNVGKWGANYITRQDKTPAWSQLGTTGRREGGYGWLQQGSVIVNAVLVLPLLGSKIQLLL